MSKVFNTKGALSLISKCSVGCR